MESPYTSAAFIIAGEVRYLLEKLPFYACEQLIVDWVALFDPEWHWKKEKPKWWPNVVFYNNIRALTKEGKLLKPLFSKTNFS